MHLSVFYNHIVRASEQTGLTLEEVLDKAQEFGISAVELDLEEALGCGKEVMKKRLEQAGISVASMYGFLILGMTPIPIQGLNLSTRRNIWERGKCS